MLVYAPTGIGKVWAVGKGVTKGHLNVVAYGPSTLTSLIPSGIMRSHSVQLSILRVSSDNLKDRDNWVPRGEPGLRRIRGGWTGDNVIDGNLELPDICIYNGNIRFVESFIKVLVRTNLG